VREVLEGKSDHSPLVRLRSLVEDLDDPRAVDQAVHEVKLYACLVRRILRRTYEHLRRWGHEFDGPDQRLVTQLQGLEARGTALVGQFRETVAEIRERYPVLPDDLASALRLVDEYLSFQYEKTVALLLEATQRHRPKVADALRERFLAALKRERKYRADHFFHAGARAKGGNAALDQRIRRLRQFALSAIAVRLRPRKTRDRFMFWAASLAAGLAMFVSIVGAVGMGFTPQSLAAPSVILGACLVYIVKDRIKETVKQAAHQDRFGVVPDRDLDILDPRSHVVTGRCIEAVRWRELEEVPEEVDELRVQDDAEVVGDRLSTGETVLHYSKRVVLYPDRLRRHRRKLEGLTDKLVLDLKHLKQRIQKDKVTLATLSKDGEGVTQVQVRRTYSAVLVMRYGVEGHPPSYEAVRLTFNRKALLAVESLEQVPGAGIDFSSLIDDDADLEDWD
jgi:hypothetical protein